MRGRGRPVGCLTDCTLSCPLSWLRCCLPVRLAAPATHRSEKGDRMESRRVHLQRRLATMAGLVALLLLAPAPGASPASTTRQVQVLDDCAPATFNAAIGPGTCIKDGGTTFSEFLAQLPAQGRAPARRLAPPPPH